MALMMRVYRNLKLVLWNTYIMITQQIRWMLREELTIGSTVYSCQFFKGINNDGFLHVLEDCQHDLF